MEIKKVEGGWEMTTIRGTVIINNLKELMMGVEHQLQKYRECPMNSWEEDEHGNLRCKRCGIHKTKTFTPEMFR